ncbi:MAG: hypothetical protein LQ338_003813 [Usnochroma carphineum]|nr:MAG: hypothetical protein LQ338_003813 [Usnochroma carphineum]
MRRLSLAQHPKPYEVENEDLPSEPFFDKDFQYCLKSGKELVGAIPTDLTQCSLSSQSNSELSQLRKSADEMKSFESRAVRRVGIVGDSAAGKSSLINSLLNIPDLAHKGDHGSAVTSFVTEYHRRSPWHTAPFTIEAEYCDQEEINNQLHELLTSYRELYQPGLDKELEDNEQLYREIRRKSEVAFVTLQSNFPDHPELTHSYLRDEAAGAFERILENLKRFAKNVLKSGIILANLPGYRDINLARVRKAEQYLLRCHEVFIVANINRVISDQSVAKFVKDQMRASAERVSVTIVCTPADDIDLVSARKQYKSVTSSRRGMKAWDAKMHEFDTGSPASSQLANIKYKYLFVAARNASIKRAVKKRYADPNAGLIINVFCVGNRDYEGADYRSREARDIAAHGSSIPDLRSACQQKPRTSIDPQIISDLQSDLKQKIEDFAECLETAVSVHMLENMLARSADAALGSPERIANVHYQRLPKNDGKFKDLDLPEPFLAAFRLKERELKYLLKNTCSGILNEVQNIEFNAAGDHISSWILDLMIHTYRDCARQTGTGTEARMHGIMKTRLNRRDIFRLIKSRIEDETQDLFNEKVDELFEYISEMCKSIRRQLEAYGGPQTESQKFNPAEVEKVRKSTFAARARLLVLQRDMETFKKGRNRHRSGS